MKKYLFLFSFLFTATLMFSQATGSVGIGTSNPDSSAALDISGIDPTNTIRGFLAPRMTLAQKTAITSPATGLLIYQTDGLTGFWYYDGTIWRQWLGNGWSLNGNTGTNPNTDKVGTKDGQDFVLKTNNTESVRITSSGNVGIGTSTPSSLLHLKSAYTPISTRTENFDSTTFPPTTPLNFTTSGSGGNWTRTTTSGQFLGVGAAKAPAQGNSKVSYLTLSSANNSFLTLSAGQSGSVTFTFKTEFDPSDELNLIIGGTTVRTWGSGYDWTTVTIGFSNIGSNTINWAYNTDGANASGSNTVYIDNVIVNIYTPTATLQIKDGNQAANKVLTCDATGLGTWQNLPAAVTYDLDWIWSPAIGSTAPFGSSPGISSDNTGSIYHRGKVKIGNSTASSYNLHVHNGSLTSGTRVQFGSVENIVDGINEFNFSDPLCPLTNANLNLGSSTNRWASVWAVNGTIQTSDISLKENISPLKYGLKEIMQLKPVSFKWKQEQISTFKIPDAEKETKLGFIAQDLQKIVPEVVETTQWKEYEENPGVLIKEEMARYGVSYSELIPVLIKAIQEQQIEIEEIKKINKYLNEEISKAEKKSKN